MDEGVGKIITALNDANMLANSVVIFYSDNGAPTLGVHSNSGSNYPLRGVSLKFQKFLFSYIAFFCIIAKRVAMGRWYTYSSINLEYIT